MARNPFSPTAPGHIRIAVVSGEDELPDIPFIASHAGGERLLFGKIKAATAEAAKTLQDSFTQTLNGVVMVEVAVFDRDATMLNLVATDELTRAFKELMSLSAEERVSHTNAYITANTTLNHVSTDLTVVLTHLTSPTNGMLMPWMRSITEILAADSMSMAPDTSPSPTPTVVPERHPRAMPQPIAPITATLRPVEVKAWRCPTENEVEVTESYPTPGWVLQALIHADIELAPGKYLVWDGRQSDCVAVLTAKEFHEAYALVDDTPTQA